MIKSLSIFIATSALAVSAFATKDASIRVQKVSKCKKSSHSKDGFLLKACSINLSFDDKIVISGSYDKNIKGKIKGRTDLLVIDSKGRNYFMANGVANSLFKPTGKIEIIKTDSSDKALIYKLKYSGLDSEDSYFRILTVRLKANPAAPKDTCVVAVSDSRDENVKTADKKAAKKLEQIFRDKAKNLVLNDEFATAGCVD